MRRPLIWLFVPALFALSAFLAPVGTDEPGQAERAAVHRAVEDYVEALYHVKPELIERSVHPALVKRGFWRAPGTERYGAPALMTYEQLHELAGQWNVGGQQGSDLSYSIEVFDVLDVTASAKLSARWGVDYMQLAKAGDRWQIVQVLWQSHPE